MSDRSNDVWEAEVSRTLDRRASDLHEAPLSLDQVKGRAGRIRRNRRIAVAGGIMAAAAVIVPVAAIGGADLLDSNSSKPPVAERDGENQREHAEDPGSFGYIEGRTVHLPDGTEMQVQEDYQGGTWLGSTVFLVRSDDETGQLSLDVTGGDAFPTKTTEIISGPVANADHTAVAYLEADGDLVTADESGEPTTLATGLTDNAQVTALTGDCAAGGCRVYVDDDVLVQPRVYDQDGKVSVAVPDALGVQDATDEGLLTVQQSYSNEGSCGGVYDVASGDFLWDGCEYFLYAFSPSARYLDATHPYLDGPGNAYAAILDAATGEEVARFEAPEGSYIPTTTWQDDEHLLATVSDGRTWSVYRIGVDGSAEQVLDPRRGDEFDPSYALLDAH